MNTETQASPMGNPNGPDPEAEATPNAAGQSSTGSAASASDKPDPAAETKPEAKPEAKPDPADPLTIVPDKPDGYQFNVSDKAKGLLENAGEDPFLGEVRSFAKAEGWTQGDFDGRIGKLVNHLAEKGMLEPVLDPAAELKALGDNGEARRRDVETFASALKTRGDIDEAEFGELLSLAPTAAGVKLVEKIKGWMRTPPDIQAAGAAGQGGDAKEEARRLARDPKYGSDPEFTRMADKKWMAAFK